MSHDLVIHDARVEGARVDIEFCLDLARRHDADVDMQVDESEQRLVR